MKSGSGFLAEVGMLRLWEMKMQVPQCCPRGSFMKVLLQGQGFDRVIHDLTICEPQAVAGWPVW